MIEKQIIEATRCSLKLCDRINSGPYCSSVRWGIALTLGKLCAEFWPDQDCEKVFTDAGFDASTYESVLNTFRLELGR